MNGAVLFTGKFSEKKEYLQRYSSDETSDDFARGRQPKDISSNAYLSILVPRAPRFFSVLSTIQRYYGLGTRKIQAVCAYITGHKRKQTNKKQTKTKQ